MTLHERIQKLMDEKNLKQVDLANATGKSKVSVTKWMRGENIPKAEALKDIAKLLDTTDEYLLTGEESSKHPMHKDVVVWDESTPVGPDEVEIAFYKTMRLACGSGSLVEVNDSDRGAMRVPRQLLDKLGIYRDKAFSAPAEDDSMKPTINDGDLIYVDENRTQIKDGRIFAVEHGGIYRCKRLYGLPGGGVRIVSDNKEEYGEEILSSEEIVKQGFRILGWVWKIDKIEKW